MKAFIYVTILLAGAAAFYHFGGVEKLGFAEPAELPETIVPPNATFVGYEQTNPYAQPGEK